jgi:hypothetical protein
MKDRSCLICLLFAMLLTAMPAFTKETPTYTRYMGSFGFAMPTGNIRSSYSYLNDSSNSGMFLSQALMNNFLELSYFKHLSGDHEGKNLLNTKVRLIEEGTIMPGIVWGAADINTQILDKRIYYMAATKSFDTFGCTIHGGYYKDPLDSKKTSFFGIEKMVFPLISLGAEYENEVMTYGIKLTPMPGLDLVIGQRDGKKELFNICYYATY